MYEQQRLPATSQFRLGNLLLFVFSILLWTFSLVWAWIYRKTSRMKTLRPFWVNAIAVGTNILLSIAFSLNLSIDTVPCWLFVYCLIVGLVGLAVHFVLTLMVFLVESNFVNNIGKSTLYMRRVEESESTPSNSTLSTFSVTKSIFLRILGWSSFSDMTVYEVIFIKKHYTGIALFFILPCLIVSTVIIILIPPYQQCRGCAVFVEPFVGYISMHTVYMITLTRLLWVARKARYHDSNGVFRELKIVLLCGCPSSLIFTILFVLDVGSLEFNYLFMYLEWGSQMFLMSVYWWAVFGNEMVRAYLASKTITGSKTGGDPMSSLDTMDKDTQRLFEEYLIQHYAVENWYFIQDVRVFKLHFEERSEQWKRQKATFIYETYVKIGSLLEVNISHETRGKISKEENELCSFDVAVAEIKRDVLRGLWLEFSSNRNRKIQVYV